MILYVYIYIIWVCVCDGLSRQQCEAFLEAPGSLPEGCYVEFSDVQGCETCRGFPLRKTKEKHRKTVAIRLEAIAIRVLKVFFYKGIFNLCFLLFCKKRLDGV